MSFCATRNDVQTVLTHSKAGHAALHRLGGCLQQRFVQRLRCAHVLRQPLSARRTSVRYRVDTGWWMLPLLLLTQQRRQRQQ